MSSNKILAVSFKKGLKINKTTTIEILFYFPFFNPFIDS